MGDVIVREHDDVRLRHSSSLGDLVGVAHVGLVAVVAVRVRAGNQDSPVVTTGRHRCAKSVRIEGRKEGSR